MDDPLVGLDNCLIVPHIASASRATRGKMAAMAAANLIAGVRGERLPDRGAATRVTPRHGCVHVLVMGVAGSGKSTVAAALAGGPRARDDRRRRAASARERREDASGIPLTDDDRRPWLASLALLLADRHERGRGTVLACSALRRTVPRNPPCRGAGRRDLHHRARRRRRDVAHADREPHGSFHADEPAGVTARDARAHR